MSENQRLDQCIGGYRLQCLLSRSNTVEVYLAEHILFHTEAVIKILAGPNEDIEKFLAQASLLTQLQHPHIIEVFDFGMVEESAFMIMDYAPNGTLRQRYPKGTCLPLATILRYTRQIASALDYIHLHNLIHRDLKPQNMLLGTNDEIMLTDFGIAVVAQHFDADSPAFRDFEGTVPYAAPEQLQGRPHKNSDLYALGIIIYEWVCGDWPFTGTYEEIVHQHLYTPPPFFSAKNREVSPAFEQVIHRALAKEPEQRFSNANDFLQALEQSYQAPALSEIALKLPIRRQFMSPLPFMGQVNMPKQADAS